MSFRLLLLVPLSGCFYSIETRCHDVPTEGSEVRGLVAVESEASGAAFPEEERAVSVTTHGIAREVFTHETTPVLEPGRIRVDFGTLALTFRVPSSTGPTTLAALEAQTCEQNFENGRTCRAIDAPVDVAATCEPTTCEWLDLTVHIPIPSPLPDEGFFYGEAHVLHREWTEQACRRVHEGSDSAFAVEL